MSVDPRPIGVFDSGIGGLSVLKHLLRLLPHERFVYLGDTARVPYGNKSAETVRTYSRQCAAFLMRHDVKMIVVACNTASALALDALAAELPIPVVGMIEPAAAAALTATTNRRIGIIGTRATVTSGAYQRALERLSAQPLALTSRACPLFVPLVEEGWLDTEPTRLIAREYLQPLIDDGIDTLVLGCTHYPLLRPLLQDLLPHVRLVDCGEAAAATAAGILGVDEEAQHEPLSHTTFFVTDATPSFAVLARQFLGRPVDDPVTATVEPIGV
jgi:glutamate racemase